MNDYWICGICGEKNSFPNTTCGRCDTFKPAGFQPYEDGPVTALPPGRITDRPVKFPPRALDHQVGGSHYVMMQIQPVEFIAKNEMEFLPGCIIKRICRFDRMGGKGVEDLKKIKHECDLLIDLKFGGDPDTPKKEII